MSQSLKTSIVDCKLSRNQYLQTEVCDNIYSLFKRTPQTKLWFRRSNRILKVWYRLRWTLYPKESPKLRCSDLKNKKRILKTWMKCRSLSPIYTKLVAENKFKPVALFRQDGGKFYKREKLIKGRRWKNFCGRTKHLRWSYKRV